MQTLLLGIGKADRERLGTVIRGTKGTISADEAAEILSVSVVNAAKMLARWTKRGWLSRIRQGLYVPMPLESRTTDVPLEDSWLVAERLYRPCYIGGWSAAEFLGLTEQIFRTVLVITTKKPRNRHPTIKGTNFVLRTIPEKAMFGFKPVWRGQVKVSVSDPARTILDMLNDPSTGGGIRSVGDIFSNYLKSDKKDLLLLIEYAKRLGNGAVYKRLGLLLERLAPEEQEIINQCRSKLTFGNSKLDPKLKADKLITRWKLWVPQNWSVKR